MAWPISARPNPGCAAFAAGADLSADTEFVSRTSGCLGCAKLSAAGKGYMLDALRSIATDNLRARRVGKAEKSFQEVGSSLRMLEPRLFTAHYSLLAKHVAVDIRRRTDSL